MVYYRGGEHFSAKKLSSFPRGHMPVLGGARGQRRWDNISTACLCTIGLFLHIPTPQPMLCYLHLGFYQKLSLREEEMNTSEKQCKNNEARKKLLASTLL